MFPVLPPRCNNRDSGTLRVAAQRYLRTSGSRDPSRASREGQSKLMKRRGLRGLGGCAFRERQELSNLDEVPLLRFFVSAPPEER
jgi:hypothetical protein